MGKNSLRLLGALFAVALLATACGSSTATETIAQAEPATSTAEEAVADDSSEAREEDEAMKSMEDVDEDASHDEGEHSHDEGEGHSHDDVLEVNADAPTPAVEIELTETDVPGVFDLAVSLTNFTITPDNVDADPIDNEGHMHLYLDGERVERFFDVDHQLTVPDGEHVVEVELSSNSHLAYAVDGEPIRAVATVVSTAEPAGSDSQGDNGEDVQETPANSIVATFVGGSVELVGDDRVEVAVGDVVTVMIESDVVEEVHLHGYDIFADVGPDEAAMMLFTADTPGRFEIEFESSGIFIAELVVS